MPRGLLDLGHDGVHVEGTRLRIHQRPVWRWKREPCTSAEQKRIQTSAFLNPDRQTVECMGGMGDDVYSVMRYKPVSLTSS